MQIYEPRADEPVDPPEPPAGLDGRRRSRLTRWTSAATAAILPPAPATTPAPIKRYVVGGKRHRQRGRERVQYLDADGKLITESLRDYTRINLMRSTTSLDEFLQAWSDADRKAALIDELEDQGVLFDALADEVGKDLDPFDLLLHVAYDHAAAHPARARQPRARSATSSPSTAQWRAR